jgi:hypothetical protein
MRSDVNFPLEPHIGTQKVSDFGAFLTSGFQIRGAQTCFILHLLYLYLVEIRTAFLQDIP